MATKAIILCPGRMGDPGTLGIVLELFVTKTGSHTCDTVIVCSEWKPAQVGQILYLNQEYWNKVDRSNYLESESRNS
jgi:hypothetical protein